MDASSPAASQSFSSASRQTARNSYKLAVKYFVNKSFAKSYELVSRLYDASFDQVSSGVIPPLLFTQIVNLHLTLLALILDESKNVVVALSDSDRAAHVAALADGDVLKRTQQIYGSDPADLPSEIVHSYCASLVASRNSVFAEDAAYLARIDQVVYTYVAYDCDPASDDPAAALRAKVASLYVFEVLPSLGKYAEARNFIERHFGAGAPDALARLQRVRTEREAEREAEQQRQAQRQAQRDARDAREAKPPAEDLHYRTLRQIRELGAAPPAPAPRRDVAGFHVAQLRQRLIYQWQLSRAYLEDNYPVILVVVVALLMGTRFVRTRRINLREKLFDTVRMAFKVSYL